VLGEARDDPVSCLWQRSHQQASRDTFLPTLSLRPQASCRASGSGSG